MKEQICKNCGEKLTLTEVAIDTGEKIYVYLCACNDMIRQAKVKEQNNED